MHDDEKLAKRQIRPKRLNIFTGAWEEPEDFDYAARMKDAEAIPDPLIRESVISELNRRKELERTHDTIHALKQRAGIQQDRPLPFRVREFLEKIEAMKNASMIKPADTDK